CFFGDDPGSFMFHLVLPALFHNNLWCLESYAIAPLPLPLLQSRNPCSFPRQSHCRQSITSWPGWGILQLARPVHALHVALWDGTSSTAFAIAHHSNSSILPVLVLAPLALLVLEEFDLAEALLGLFERLVGSTQILALARENLVTTLHLLDHGRSPSKETSLE